MSIHFASMTVSQIVDRAHKLMEEGNALARLAGALAEFEETTGRKLFVSEADQGTQYVGTPGPDLRLTFPDVAAKVDIPVEPDIEDAPAAEPIKKARPVDVEAAAAKPARDQEPVKKAAALAKPAPAAAKPKAGERLWGKLSLPERRIVQHLEKLPDAFTPAEDLTIAELLTSGNRIEAVALQLEVSADQALARWKGFLCSDVLGPNGKPSIDGQQQLLNALRYRRDTARA